MANHHISTDSQRPCVTRTSTVNSSNSRGQQARKECVCSVRAPALRVGLVPANVHVLVREHRRELGKQTRQHTIHLPTPHDQCCGTGLRCWIPATVVLGFLREQNKKTARTK